MWQAGELVWEYSGAKDLNRCLEKVDLTSCGLSVLGLFTKGAGSLAESAAKPAAKAGSKWLRNMLKKPDDLLRKKPSMVGCVPNSFLPGTLVLMADGSHVPIEQVDTGDRVMTTDPATGETVPHHVRTTIIGTGSKDLVEVTVDTDGARGDGTGTVVATEEHPFWVDDQGRWIDAEDLEVGDDLRSPDGAQATVTGLSERTRHRTVHNLSVSGVHTYYVRAGTTDLLVHNAPPPDGCRLTAGSDIPK